MGRPRVSFAAAAILLASTAAPALAGDIPGSAATRATLPISTQRAVGVWERPNDSDWYQVRLTRGETYAFSVSSDATDIGLVLLDAAGRALTSGGGGLEVGFEYLAPLTGTYHVNAERLPFDTGDARDYAVGAAPDFAASGRTRCRLRPGVAQRRAISFRGDADWFRIDVHRGGAYVVSASDRPAGDIGRLAVAVVDASGRAVPCGSEVVETSGVASLTFAAPSGGVPHARVRDASDESFGSYTASFSRVR